MRRCGRKWMRALPWMFVLCVLAGCAMAVYMQRYDTPVYRAVYTLYAIPDGDGAAFAEGARMLARDCTLLTHTDTFRRAVLANVISDGKTTVSVHAVEGTHMLEVSASGPDAEIVYRLANAVGTALCERIPRMFHAHGVKEIAPAVLPVEPHGPSAPARIAAAMLATFVAAGLLAVCLPGKKDKISYASPEAEAFRLGAVGDTRRLVKRYLKQTQRAQQKGMLLQQTDRLLRENIRQLVLVLRTTLLHRKGCSLVITSMQPDDEEAALTVLLASEMAQQGFRVLLMEMDAQKPVLASLLGVKARADLYDYLNGRAELGEVIQHTSIQTLSFVDSLHPAAAVADLAATAPFEALIRSAEEHFDFVILHAASRAESTDASMLGLVAGSTVLVARDGRYSLDDIEAAAREMARLGKPAKGVVFTRARV